MWDSINAGTLVAELKLNRAIGNVGSCEIQCLENSHWRERAFAGARHNARLMIKAVQEPPGAWRQDWLSGWMSTLKRPKPAALLSLFATPACEIEDNVCGTSARVVNCSLLYVCKKAQLQHVNVDSVSDDGIEIRDWGIGLDMAQQTRVTSIPGNRSSAAPRYT